MEGTAERRADADGRADGRCAGVKNQSVFLAAVTKEIPTPQLPHHTRRGATRVEALRTDLANKRDFRHVMRVVG